MGGKGDAFNLGEMTVSRCSVQLACGTVGHGYIRGRSKQAAPCGFMRCVAANRRGAGHRCKILSVLAGRREAVVAETASKAAATRVDFLHSCQRTELMQPDALKGGFADLPVQSATAFRAVMQAMARPGTIHHLDGAVPPAPLSAAAGVVLLTLCGPGYHCSLAGRLIRQIYEAGFPFIPARPLPPPATR